MNKVILIGESHYHGLNLARSFGIRDIKPYGIVVGNRKPGFLEASKYWKKTYSAADNEEAISLAVELFGSETEKPLLMPWADGALFAIDQHYDELKKRFLLSSIAEIPGEIGRWMNKKKQAELGKKFGLAVSPTEEIQLPISDSDVFLIKEEFSFPVFLKPVDSREGTKKDMRSISSVEELREYSTELLNKGYHRILLQEYLKIDFELDLMGYCNKNDYSYTVAKKIRTWPLNGGAACYGKVISPGAWETEFDNIVKQLAGLGYSGPFDIDLFLVGSRLYFNEINWRSSANVYGAVKSGNNYPCAWYKSAVGSAGSPFKPYSGRDIYFMNEFWDFHHVLARKIHLIKWLQDVRKTDTFAFGNHQDPRPFRRRLRSSVFKN